jgi:hypothetical protein
MDAAAAQPGDGSPVRTLTESRLWLLIFGGLLAWQGWLTLSLFGPKAPWQALRDERPIVSGRHPLHLYHGALGARSFLRNGTLSCYDPAFQAGYPKTPVFDSGSRPAEMFLLAAGGDFNPAAYKVGLAVCCLLAPLALVVAARGVGLGRGGACLAVLLGQLVWWSRPGRRLLQEGNLDLLLAALAVVAQAGLLIRLDRRPGLRAWLGVFLTGFLGWLIHPLLSALLVPLFLLYYLSVGARHHAAWSLLLFAGLAAAVGCNYFWLTDWVSYWWLRVPLPSSDLRLAHRTLPMLWHAELWGQSFDRGLVLLLLGAGTAGGFLFNHQGERATARLLGLGAAGMLLLAVLGVVSESFGRVGTPGLLVPGLLLAVPLAAHAFEAAGGVAVRWSGHAWAAVLLPAAALTGLVVLSDIRPEALATRLRQAGPLPLGLTPERQAVVAALQEHTTPEARILWEDRPKGDTTRWTALLPVLTGRHYLGGLDPDAGIEYTADGLVGPTLAGKPLKEWSDRELADYCRKYNVGWVVCWSPAALARFDHWEGARRTVALEDDGRGWLFTLTRTSFAGRLFDVPRRRSFVLKGQARWLSADPSRIALADVVPDNGEVWLSLHYQEGLTVWPSRVKVDFKKDESDPIPLIRLQLDSPVARVTITWDN